jgi:toxin ParE1/3/4
VSRVVRQTPFAEEEIEQHVRRYEGESAGLGLAFLSDFQRVIELIVEYPEVGRVVTRVRPVVRRFPLRRFPFFIIYRELGNVVEIVAVAPMKRRPNYWRSTIRVP